MIGTYFCVLMLIIIIYPPRAKARSDYQLSVEPENVKEVGKKQFSGDEHEIKWKNIESWGMKNKSSIAHSFRINFKGIVLV